MHGKQRCALSIVYVSRQ